MTIDIQTISSTDVSKGNEVYNINESLLPTNVKIAAIRWQLSSRNHVETRILVLRAVFSLILEKMPNLMLWCVVGDSAWQPDTKIMRYKKLFKRLKARGAEFNHSSLLIEDKVELNGKLKFFGAAQLSWLSIESAVNVMAEETCSYIIVIPEKLGIKELISKGWNDCEVIDLDLLGKVVENNGLLLKAIGHFDDPEAGFLGLGSPDLMKELAQ